MKRKEMICIVCPVGCQLEAHVEEGPEIQVGQISGNLCKKGLSWAEQELINPMRTLTSSIRVEHGDLPLVSVKTDSPIPRGAIPEVMNVIRSARVKAPVHSGDLLIVKPAGLSCNIVATKTVHSDASIRE